MKLKRCLLPMIALAMVCLPQSVARATEAEEIFNRCVASLEVIVKRCQDANKAVVEECTPIIKALLAEGKREEALHVAERCIKKIREQSAACIRHIHERCELCIHKLRELGATELAERLAERCRLSVRAVEVSRGRAIVAIRNLFL